MKHLSPKGLVIIATISLQACGGGLMSSGNIPQSNKKKQEPTKVDGDQTASDPQVVTGAYLACEVSTIESKDDKAAVGCSIMANNRRIAAINPSRIDFIAEHQGRKRQPDKESTASGYQALFMASTKDIPQTQFAAQIFKNSSLVKEVLCDGSRLPCQVPLSSQDLLEIKADGLWSADSKITEASKQALRPECPNNPNMYCDANGNLFTVAPSSKADQDTQENCMNLLQQTANIFVQSTLGFDPRKLFDSRPVPVTMHRLKLGESCIVRKRIRTGTPLTLLNQGEGCYMFMVNKGGQAQNVIIKKSNVPDPKTLMEQLAPFECKY